MKITLLSVVAIFTLNSMVFATSDSEVSVSLDKLAKDLVSAYQISHPKEQKATIAILPFHTSEELAKRKTGNVLAELLTHSFRKYPSFILVERVDLNKIFTELKLGMSGVVNPEEALKVGKLSGATLQILGSMEKIGAKYHINARMVQTETGDIVATAYNTISASSFDDKAQYYLTDLAVPKTQSIGVYMGTVFKGNSRWGKSVTYTDTNTGSPISPDPEAARLSSYAPGVRYDLSSKIQLDYTYYSTNYRLTLEVGVNNVYNNFNFSGSRFLVAYKHPLNEKLFLYSAVGICRYSVQNIDNITLAATNSSGGRRIQNIHLAETSITTPVIYERFEYRPQSRIALGVACGYELKKSTLRFMHQKLSDFTQFFFEPTASFYF